MVTDPIADLINRLKTAQMAKLASLSVPFSNVKFAIMELLFREGYVSKVEKRGKKVKKYIDIDLKYEEGKPEIRGVKRLSKPSHRVYLKVSDIKPVKYGHGLIVLSTPKGILTGREAIKEKMGGEALLTIW